MATVTVIVPTKGRQSLSATIASVLPELRREDELLVAADGAHAPHPYARGLCSLAQGESAGRVVYLEKAVEGSVFGNGQRDAGLRHVYTSHVAFLDDDDVYEPGALDAFHDAAEDDPDAVHVFKARWGAGHHWQGVLWADREFREQNVGTCQVLWPWRHDMPRWMDFNERGIVSDFGWMRAALGDAPIVWHDALVATVRP